MLSKQQFFLGLFVLMVLVFTGGFFAGRSSKQCPTIISETITSDTTDSYLPITGGAGSPLTVITYPANTPIAHKSNKIAFNAKNITPNAINVTDCNENDTLIRENVTASFISIDTLRFDSLFVAITDTGNCNGIQIRHSVFGGKIKAQTIINTITKVAQKPTPLFQLNGGIQSSFIGKWKSVDVGPALQLQLKQKYSIGYSYMIGSSTHNISLLTKLK